MAGPYLTRPILRFYDLGRGSGNNVDKVWRAG
jgi:hypothetical protein